MTLNAEIKQLEKAANAAVKKMKKFTNGKVDFLSTVRPCGGRVSAYIGVSNSELQNYMPAEYQALYDKLERYSDTTTGLLWRLAEKAGVNLGVGMSYHDCNDHYLVFKHGIDRSNNAR